MKTLIKLALAAVILCSAFAAKAEWPNGHWWGNPTFFQPCYSAPVASYACANSGYRYSPPSCNESWSINGSSTRIGNTVFHNYTTSDGGGVSGTVSRIGDSVYVSINGW